jgi:hypothetical protein
VTQRLNDPLAGLQVADGVPQQSEAEQAFKELFAQTVAAAYTGLSADDRQSLVQCWAPLTVLPWGSHAHDAQRRE